MNQNGNTIMSVKICEIYLLYWDGIYILFLSEIGKTIVACSEYDIHSQKEYPFWECILNNIHLYDWLRLLRLVLWQHHVTPGFYY